MTFQASIDKCEYNVESEMEFDDQGLPEEEFLLFDNNLFGFNFSEEMSTSAECSDSCETTDSDMSSYG
jgi:hypothetical protein